MHEADRLHSVSSPSFTYLLQCCLKYLIQLDPEYKPDRKLFSVVQFVRPSVLCIESEIAQESFSPCATLLELPTLLQCDTRSRHSGGRLIEKRERRGTRREGGGVRRWQKLLLREILGTILLCCVHDFILCFTRLTCQNTNLRTLDVGKAHRQLF